MGETGAASETAAPLPLPVSTSPAPSVTNAGDMPWLPIAGGAGALLLAGLVGWAVVKRRGSAAGAAADFVPPTLDAPPPTEVEPEPAAVPLEPAEPRATDAPVLTLEAVRMSATLINATLTYRLAVTNTGRKPIENLEIGGDMTAAHAARPVEEQLASDATELPPLHRIAMLAPGESVMLGGDIRLPLTAIRPIRHGPASLFVPLARFGAAWSAADGTQRRRASTFLVGQLPQPAGDRLQPFRLDLGPRMYGDLGQRLLARIS